MDSKIEIRKRILARQQDRALPEVSNTIVQRLADFLSAQKFSTVAIYSPLPGEISLNSLLPLLPDVAFCYPRVQKSELYFYHIQNIAELSIGAFGILEPDPQLSPATTATQIDAVVVPGVGFDRKAQRIGRGKGYYDRFLQNYSGIKIGVCAGWQILDQLPAEPHDVAMDYVVTEKFILRPLRTLTKGTLSSWNLNP